MWLSLPVVSLALVYCLRPRADINLIVASCDFGANRLRSPAAYFVLTKLECSHMNPDTSLRSRYFPPVYQLRDANPIFLVSQALVDGRYYVFLMASTPSLGGKHREGAAGGTICRSVVAVAEPSGPVYSLIGVPFVSTAREFFSLCHNTCLWRIV